MAKPSARYDEIGRGYATSRRPDARMVATNHAAIPDLACLVNLSV